jgi:hypothetical protein
MTLDFDDALLAPHYEGDQACDATLILKGGARYPTLPDGSALRVIDCTAGQAVQQAARGGSLTIETIRPVAYMRESSLRALGLVVADIEGGELTIDHTDTGGDAVTWGIKSYQVKPTPSGPGEIEIILIDRE